MGLHNAGRGATNLYIRLPAVFLRGGRSLDPAVHVDGGANQNGNLVRCLRPAGQAKASVSLLKDP